MRLDHGAAVVAGRRSPLSLYDKNLATYDEGDAFDHASAVGFIEIFGLPLRVEAARHGAVGKHHGAAWTWTDRSSRTCRPRSPIRRSRWPRGSVARRPQPAAAARQPGGTGPARLPSPGTSRTAVSGIRASRAR